MDPADDAGTGDGAGILHALEGIDVVYSQSWQYDDPVARWPSAWARPPAAALSGIGGAPVLRHRGGT